MDCIKDKTPTSANVIRSVSDTPLVNKSHIHMVIILVNLSAECDDSGQNKLLSLKQTLLSPYWKDFKKVIHLEFQSFIENNI